MASELLLIVAISIIGPIIGSFIGVIRKPSERFMYNMLSFAGGVMLAISFLELIPESIALTNVGIGIIGLVIGAGLMFLVDKLIPHIHPEFQTQEHGMRLKKTAWYLIVGIFLHNFPEGMAIAIGSVLNSNMGIVIALAIAIHNIPEGICTSAPYFATTKKRLRTFLISSSTIIPILLGFFLASFMYQYISNTLIGLVIAATAGLMIYITSDEIIPTCSCKISNHQTIFSLFLGILFVMMLGLL